MSEKDFSRMSCKEDSMPNWDEFSFEGELEARKLQFKIFIDAVRTEIEEDEINGQEENEINELQRIEEELKASDDYMFSHSENFNTDLKKLLQEIENLKKENTKLDMELPDLEKKENRLKDEYKLNKEAYNMAFQKYCNNFDIKLDIDCISDEVYVAHVKFASLKTMTPLKITINRSQKKILDFDANNLLTKEEINMLIDNQDILRNVPVLFARIHQQLVKRATL